MKFLQQSELLMLHFHYIQKSDYVPMRPRSVPSRVSDFFPVRYSYRPTEPPALRKMNRRSVLVARAYTFPRIGAYIRNAAETSNAVAANEQGELPGPRVLINRHGGSVRFGIACHEIPFLWLTRENARRRDLRFENRDVG